MSLLAAGIQLMIMYKKPSTQDPPQGNICIANKDSGEKCYNRRLPCSLYCEEHVTNKPYGLPSDSVGYFQPSNSISKINVEFGGIEPT